MLPPCVASYHIIRNSVTRANLPGTPSCCPRISSACICGAGILVPFFQDVFASADYGRIIVAYFSAVILSWALAAGIESSRLDAHRSRLIQFFSPLVSLEVVSGVGILTPILWVAPFLRMPGNTVSRHLKLGSTSFFAMSIPLKLSCQIKWRGFSLIEGIIA